MVNQIENSAGRVFTIETIDNGNGKELEVQSHSFDEAIKLVGFGGISWQIFLVSALVMLAVLNETMGISILIPAAHCDLNLSATDKGMLTGVSFAGIILTSHLWGYLADTKGRKNVIILSLALTFVCSLVSSMARDFVTIAILRLLVGMCISAPSATIYAYLGEFTNTEKRTMIISFASVAVGLSSIFTGTLGWLVLSFDWRVDIWSLVTFRPWRLLIILYSLPGAIAAVWMVFLPESPKFYLSQGRDDLALKVLQKVFLGNKAGASLDEFPVQRIVPEVCEDEVGSQRKGFSAILCSMWNQTAPLFRSPNVLYFSVCCALQFGMFFVSAGMGLWYPEIINRLTSTIPEDSEAICDILEGKNGTVEDLTPFFADEECDDHMTQDVFVYVVVLGSIYTFLYLIISAILHKINRGYILFFNLFISGTSGMLLLFIDDMYLVLMLFCTFMVFAGISISLVNGAAVSIFPTNVRAMAVCLSLMMGRLGSVAGTNLIGLIMEQNCTVTFALFAACSLVGAMLTLILPRR
ncbi:synaptic vesicle glycoprotein 2B-like isoform X1 [Malaya genurostris]|uniref:synaptic vesicle glycoprotein 2B-like isoform X1 n=1 Tax=Malaya genurostris TaxID=325434 RepID=UPI0026F3A41D|nr:synaptic vesicle glycoprotein 2B-like isoform X1 [Malaya genurostris]